jgi:hypothetical protein
MSKLIGILFFIGLAYLAYILVGYRFVIHYINDNADPRMVIGNQNAETTILAFIDYETVESRHLIPVLTNLAAADSEIKIHILPVTQKMRQHEELVNLAIAAKEQRQFLTVNNLLLSLNEKNMDIIESRINALGVDYSDLITRSRAQSVLDEAKLYHNYARVLGIHNLPTFYIAGKKMPPALYSLGELREEIDNLNRDLIGHSLF